jgi:plastocyanin
MAFNCTLNNDLILIAILIISLEITVPYSFQALATSKPIEVKITAVPILTNMSQSSEMRFQFIPPTILIKKGDTVKWVNEGKSDHTISSIFFKSDIIYPAGSKRYSSTFNYTFNRPGIYVYIDRLHPSTGGVVYVNSSETQRELIPTSQNVGLDVRVEMPQNSAYQNALGSFFIPSFLNVSEGVKVTWTNKDYIPHTATAADGSFDTKPVLTGKSVSEVMKTPGVYAYYCKIHPWMIATIQVTQNSSLRT